MIGTATAVGIPGVTTDTATTSAGIAMTGVVLDATTNTIAAGAAGNAAGGVSGFIAGTTTAMLSLFTATVASGPLGWAILGVGLVSAVGGEPTRMFNKYNITAYFEWKQTLDAEIEEILCRNYE